MTRACRPPGWSRRCPRTSVRILGTLHELGTIEPGKLADITVVRGDPLFDFLALAQIDVTVKDGIAYRRAERITVLPAN